jgi:hypothetical protein
MKSINKKAQAVIAIVLIGGSLAIGAVKALSNSNGVIMCSCSMSQKLEGCGYDAEQEKCVCPSELGVKAQLQLLHWFYM